jgi:sialidase-1
VCDIKSWPLGQGAGIGHETTWKRLLDEYGFTREQALHIVSLNDRVVPPEENTFELARRYRLLGGSIDIIEVAEGTEKSNGHHFDHPDPKRVADFIETHASR